MYPQFRRGHLAAAVLFASSNLLGGQALAEDERLEELDERAESVVQLGDEVVLGTAEQELKQAPGVSIITAEDIRKRPPVNDLSEIIRTMPGVNLTGNSSSGQRGTFDGNLTVRQKLVIFSTGKVTGKIRYGKIVIEEGGQLSGEITFGTSGNSDSKSSSSTSTAKGEQAAIAA